MNNNKIVGSIVAATLLAATSWGAVALPAHASTPRECPSGWVPRPTWMNPRLGPCVPGSIGSPTSPSITASGNGSSQSMVEIRTSSSTPR
jgi:hypothetical protein